LQAHPDDAMAASRVGYLLNKSGRGREAADYLLKAFDSFSNSGQHSMAVMVADELLSVQGSRVEIMHRLSQMADQKDLAVPILQIYRKYKGFRQLPLFSALSELEFLQLLRCSKYHDFRKNKVIIKEGARGEDIYLVIEGQVKVIKKTKGKKDVQVACLGQGDFMGEIAYISNKRRSATIKTETPCQLLSWHGSAIKELNDRYPQVTKVLFKTFWERSLDTVLSLSRLFAHLEKEQKEKIINLFEVKTYRSGEPVLKEGEDNPEGALFIIKKGEAVVFKENEGDFRHPLAALKVGDVFGEYSVILKKPCMATVMPKSELEVIILQRSDFLKIIKKDDQAINVLEELSKERLDKSLLHMSYFKYIKESKRELN
jgi:CRP-like cAMP-binding protein